MMSSVISSVLKKLEVPVGERETLSVLRNPDLLPVKPKHRQWGFWSNFAYWGIISFSMGTWLSASSSLTLGLSVKEIIGAYIIGDVVTICFTLANSYPGTDWHIGYTICQRVVFGIYGSGLGIFVRILLSIVNYGSNAWLGGLSISLLLSTFSKSFMEMPNNFHHVKMTRKDFIGFIVFHVISCFFYLMRPQKMNKPLIISCFMAFFAMLGMVIFLVNKANGYGDLFNLETSLKGSKRGWTWLYLITIWFSAVSPGSTNQSDYSRFASSKTKLYLGTIIALLLPTTIIPLFGIIGASTTKKIYGEEIWMPTDIVLTWLTQHYDAKTRCASFFISISFIFSQICLNVLTCGFAGGIDLSGVLPKFINAKRGALITAMLSFAVQPWNFYNSTSSFLIVMSSFGVITTPIISIIVCDYFLIRKMKYKLSQVFEIKGDYYYNYGFNFRAYISFILGVAPGLPGMAYQVKSFNNSSGILNFYYGDTFFAFLISFTTYYVLCWFFPISFTDCDDEDYYNAFTEKERLKYNLKPFNEIESETYEIIEIADKKTVK